MRKTMYKLRFNQLEICLSDDIKTDEQALLNAETISKDLATKNGIDYITLDVQAWLSNNLTGFFKSENSLDFFKIDLT